MRNNSSGELPAAGRLSKANAEKYENVRPVLDVYAQYNAAGTIHCTVTLRLKRQRAAVFSGGRVSNDGNFWNEIVELTLSPHQVSVLQALLKKTMLDGHALHSAVWYGGGRSQRAFPLDASKRASFSRTMRRLERRGLIARAGTLYSLTASGVAIGGLLLLRWRSWGRYRNKFLNTRR